MSFKNIMSAAPISLRQAFLSQEGMHSYLQSQVERFQEISPTLNRSAFTPERLAKIKLCFQKLITRVCDFLEPVFCCSSSLKEGAYYITSCNIDAELIGKSIRNHWQIESNLHWSLDVVLREDKICYRHKIGAQNFAAIRKIVLGALGKDKSYKCGKASKRILAASDPVFRENFFFNGQSPEKENVILAKKTKTHAR